MHDTFLYFLSADCGEIRAVFCAVVQFVDNVTILSTVLSDIFNTLGNPSLLCVLGTHLLIHLREAADEGRNEGTSYGSNSTYAVEFEHETELSDLGKRVKFPCDWNTTD